MDRKIGTLGLFLYMGETFTVGTISFHVKEIRESRTKTGEKALTCLLSYTPALKEDAAVVLFQHKELDFYHTDTFKMWLGRQTTKKRAHIFIAADKTIKIYRGITNV